LSGGARVSELANETIGFGPSEKIVDIVTIDGNAEQVVVSERKIENGYLRVRVIEITPDSILAGC
jgi:hypothetical protein